MKQIRDLPATVMRQIIRLLRRKDMAQCLRVSHRFYYYTIDEFYRSLKITEMNWDKYFVYYSKIRTAFDTSLSSKWSLIKHMELRGSSRDETKYLHNCFINMVPIFSALTFIEIYDKFISVKSILEYMLTTLDTTSLPHLQELIVSSNEYSTSNIENLYYINICYKFRQSLTHLEICYPHSAYCLESYENNGTQLDLLPFFKNLRNLEVNYDPEEEQAGPLFDSTVISACPNLTSFSLTRRSRLMRPDLLTPNQLKEVPRNKLPEFSARPGNSNQLKLKTVNLYIQKMNTACWYNILSNIPTSQLDNFSLKFEYGPETIEWIKNMNLTDIEVFLQHIKASKQFDFNARSLVTSTSSSAKSLIKPTLISLNNLWELSITCTKHNDNTKFRKVLDVILEDSQKQQASLTIRNRSCRLQQTLNESDFFQNKYSHLQFAQYDITCPLQNQYEIGFIISKRNLFSKLNYLIRYYAHVKDLQVWVGPKDNGHFILCRKPLTSDPSHAQENKMHHSNKHRSYVEVSIDPHLLSEFYSEEQYIDFPIKIKKLILNEIPVMQDDDRHFQFKFKYRLPHLVLSFISDTSLRKRPIHITIFNHANLVLIDVVLTTDHCGTFFAYYNTNHKYSDIESRYTFASIDFDKLTVCDRGQPLFVKTLRDRSMYEP